MHMDDNKKPKLLMTASTFPRWEGDTEPRFIFDLAKSLLPYFRVTVLVPSAPKAKSREIMEGVEVLRYRYFPVKRLETLCYPGAIVPRIKEKKQRGLLVPFLFLALWWKLFRIGRNYDVIHAHWLVPQGIVQGFLHKTPYIVTGHGGDVSSLNGGLFRMLKRKCLKNARCITTVTKLQKEKINQIYPNTKTTIISMGCYIDHFGKQYALDNFFKQNGKKVILFVGRLAEIKGVTYLIEAMKQVDAKLCIVGNGPLREELEQQAREQGDKIEFIGSKTHEELKTVYASADLFVAPSITAKNGDVEGLSLVNLEAMASGLPVIAGALGGTGDLIQSGENGILLKEKDVDDLANKINLLLQDHQEYEKIVSNGLITVAQYDYAVIGKKYADLLFKAME